MELLTVYELLVQRLNFVLMKLEVNREVVTTKVTVSGYIDYMIRHVGTSWFCLANFQ